MAYITQVKNGFRAYINKRGVRGSKTFETKIEANLWAARREREIEAGNVAGGKKTDGRTLHQLLEKFLEEEVHKRRGERWERAGILRFVREFKDRPLKDFDRGVISEWKVERPKVVAPSSVRRDMTLLRTILEIARRDWGWLEFNPIQDVIKPPGAPARTRLIAPEEITKVLEALHYDEEGPVLLEMQKVAVALLIALETGMRAGELVRAEVSGKVAYLRDQKVRGDATKNSDERAVPLSMRARELYAKVGNRLDLNLGTLDGTFRRAREMAGLKGFTFHDSRATALTRLAEKVDVLTLARIIGHRDTKSLMIYYRKSASDIAGQLG